MGIEGIAIADLPDSLIDAHASLLSPYSVAITKLDPSQVGLLGSAVLLQYRTTYGLLTARHVADVVRNHSEFCLSLKTGVHRFPVDVAHAETVHSQAASTAESGPDPAFIRLPSHAVSEIQAFNSFVSLRSRSRAVVFSWMPGRIFVTVRDAGARLAGNPYAGFRWRPSRSLRDQWATRLLRERGRVLCGH